MQIDAPPKTGDAELDKWLLALVEKLRYIRHLECDFIEIPESGTAPSAPGTNRVRVYAVESGGKTQLAARFPTGAAQQIAIEP